MRNFALKSSYLLVVFVLCCLSSCKKYVEGPKGDPGTPGKKGNLKQAHVTKHYVASSAWKLNTDRNWWESTIYLPEITNEVLAGGETSVYVQIENVWWRLPRVEPDAFLQQSIIRGSLRLTYFTLHAGAGVQPASTYYRIEILSPAP